uniref:Uncharacterized protein n=1 Tax=Arundo donax TaxID=35708 RepID=A0A0A8Z1K4_ARUDO
MVPLRWLWRRGRGGACLERKKRFQRRRGRALGREGQEAWVAEEGTGIASLTCGPLPLSRRNSANASGARDAPASAGHSFALSTTGTDRWVQEMIAAVILLPCGSLLAFLGVKIREGVLCYIFLISLPRITGHDFTEAWNRKDSSCAVVSRLCRNTWAPHSTRWELIGFRDRKMWDVIFFPRKTVGCAKDRTATSRRTDAAKPGPSSEGDQVCSATTEYGGLGFFFVVSVLRWSQAP